MIYIRPFFSSMTCSQMPVEVVTFPAGETRVRIDPAALGTEAYLVQMDFTGNDDLINLLQVVDILRDSNPGADISLDCSYFPAARQDRRMTAGESLTVKVIANLINSCKFTQVTICDPHSDVTPALIDNVRVISQADCLFNCLGPKFRNKWDIFLAPDAGALKKIYDCAKKFSYPIEVVCANKTRDVSTGKITGVEIPDVDKLEGKNVLVVDDICDGGASFIQLASVIQSSGVTPADLSLYVTHGIFSKGQSELRKFYNEIFYFKKVGA
jgi:ribose-phosphate pyrophosphokinase